MKVRRLSTIAAALMSAIAALPALAQDFIAGIPRNETLIVQGHRSRMLTGSTSGRPVAVARQTSMACSSSQRTPSGSSTQKAARTPGRMPSPVRLPNTTPISVEMTVKLRDGIFWSDGVEFTADDVVFTVQTLMKTPGMNWSAPLNVNVELVESS